MRLSLLLLVAALACREGLISVPGDSIADFGYPGSLDDASGSVQRDGPGNWYVPVNAAQFSKLGLTPPSHCYPLQETSGNALDTIGSMTLVANPGTTLHGTGGPGTIGYQQSVAGWVRKAISTTDDTQNQGLVAGAGVGPNIATQSVAMLVYIHMTSRTTIRELFGFGTLSTFDLLASWSDPALADAVHLDSNAVGSNGVYTHSNATTNDLAILIVNDITNSRQTIYTNEEKIVGIYHTISNGGADGNKGLGVVLNNGNASTSSYLWAAMWQGAAAEFTDATAATLFDALAIPRPWTVAFDDPVRHWYVPTTAADFAFLNITAPDSVWPMQETSANFLDSIGTGFTLTGSPAAYAQTFSTWTRKGPTFVAGSSNFARAAAGTGPNPSTTSVLLIGYILPGAIPAASRHIMSIGGAAAATEATVQVTSTGLVEAKIMAATTDGAAGNYNGDGKVRLFALKYDRTNGTAVLYTDLEKIVGTYNSGVTDGNKGFGFMGFTPNNASFSVGWAAIWSGAHAELTDAQVKTLLNILTRNGIPWT